MMVLAPNLLLLFFPVKDNSAKVKLSAADQMLTVLERIGQAGVFTLPVFVTTPDQDAQNEILAGLMLILIMIYYYCWYRFFSHQRRYKYLFAPLSGFPIPMAIIPVMYFVTASWMFHSILLLMFTFVLALGHITISYKSFKASVSLHSRAN